MDGVKELCKGISPKSIARQVPVTSVEFLTETIVVSANGSELRVHDTVSKRVVGSAEVLPGHVRIHGIQKRNDRIEDDGVYILTVFGAKSWTVVRIRLTLTADDKAPVVDWIRQGLVHSAEDWIKAAQWVQMACDGEQAWGLALALAHCQVTVCETETGRIVLAAQCAERSLLYAAALWGHTIDELTVAGGTVFNEVLLWQAQDPTGAVSQRLRGHDGVIFGLGISADGSTIASVSDDRTVRVWNKQTGELEHTLYGHGARVWTCVILDRVIVSGSEDGTCRVWDRRSGECVDVWPQSAKSVWAAAASPQQTLVAAGGGDGSLGLWPVGARQLAARRVEDTCQLGSLGGGVRAVALLDCGAAVVATDAARIELHVTTRNDGEPRLLAHAPECRGYAVAAGAPGLAAVGLRDGSVVVVAAGGGITRRLRLHAAAVQRVAVAAHGNGAYDLFTASATDCVLWSRITCAPAGPLLSAPVAWLRLTPRAQWTGAAGASAGRAWVALGTAHGALHVYAIPVDLPADHTPALSPAASVPHAHGHAALSCVAIRHADAAPRGVAVLTGGRDGMLRAFSVVADGGDADAAIRITQITEQRLTGGWVERLLFIDQNQHMPWAAVTFHRKRLAVIRISARPAAIASVACAAAAKPWAVACAPTGALTVAVMVAGQLRVHAVPAAMAAESAELVAGLSAADVRAVAVIRISDRRLWVAAAGDDGHVRVLRVQPAAESAASRLCVESEARRHVSAVRCVVLAAARLVVTAGAGGALRCWHVDDGGGRLRALGDARQEALPGAAARVMAVAVLDDSASTHVAFAAAYSDSSIRVWLADTSTGRLELLAHDARRLHGCCVLSLATVRLADGRVLLLSGCTRGQMMVWDTTKLLNKKACVEEDIGPPMWSCKVHQSGINSIDTAVVLQNGAFVVASADSVYS
ncbi:WD repeat-containing protein 6 [Coemansia sp. RSA 2320]|nr:WD repeat-containing protein 6 [Coemansia sp. RSA 2320]